MRFNHRAHPSLPSCFMACCKAAGRLTVAVSFYPAANLRKGIKVVNNAHGVGFFLFADDEKGFGLRHVPHTKCFSSVLILR